MNTPRLTIEEINAFNPSPERPLEVECDDGWYTMEMKRIKIISRVKPGVWYGRCVDYINSNDEILKASSSVVVGLHHYPSIAHKLLKGFQIGDKVRAFGVNGTVVSVSSAMSGNYPIEVQYHGLTHSVGHDRFFTTDGRDRLWHKEPSLILVERPRKTVKKSFWMWADKTGAVMDYLMDESGVMPSHRPALCKGEIGLCTKIPGTEVVLEVEVM